MQSGSQGHWKFGKVTTEAGADIQGDLTVGGSLHIAGSPAVTSVAGHTGAVTGSDLADDPAFTSTYAAITGLNVAGAAPQFTSPLAGTRTPAAATTQHVFDSLPESVMTPWVITPPAALFAASAASAWYLANAATFMRFSIGRPRTFRYVNFYVGVQSGNIQVGVSLLRPGSAPSNMDSTRVAHSGVIACPSPGVARIDLGFFTLTPGDYALFLWCDNTTAQFMHGLATGLTATRLQFASTGLSGGVVSGLTTIPTTTRWVSGLTLEASYLPTVLLGDSITQGDNAGAGTAGAWFSTADQETGYRFYPITNVGVPGATTTQILSQISAFSGQRYGSVLGGTNDIGQSLSSATIISNLQTLYAAAVSAGLQSFLACTIPPRCGSGGVGTSLTAQQKAGFKAVNAWIRANHSSYVGAKLVDWTWALSDGSDESTPLSANFVDGVHPNATGTAIMKRFVKNATRDWL